MLFSLLNNASAQNVKGFVTDSVKNPLENVTVFIYETSQGFQTDKNGCYQLFLVPGKYTVVYQKIGYRQWEEDWVISSDSISNIKITPLYTSPFYSFTDTNDEHQGAPIVDELLKQSFYFSNTINNFQANSYINGIFNIRAIPDIIDKLSFKLVKNHISDVEHQTFTEEIYRSSEYFESGKFSSQDKFSVSNVPKDVASLATIDPFKNSIYAPKKDAYIRPIASNSHTYYRYLYRGYYKDDDRILHKIEIVPKLNNPELAKGYVYVEDESWMPVFTEFTIGKSGAVQTTVITYQQLLDDLSFPISSYTTTRFDRLGLRAETLYTHSIEYENVSYRDVDGDLIQEELNNLEITELDDNSTIWNKVRTVPAVITDASNEDWVNPFDDLKESYNPNRFLLGRLILGDYIFGSNQSKWAMKYGGVKMMFYDYNYVDGFWLGDRFDLIHRLDDGRRLNIKTFIYYTTARHRLLGGGDVIYSYDPSRRGAFTFSVGSKSEDFNSLTVTRYQNYFASLVMGENYNFFYQRDYATASNVIYPTKKLKVTASLGIERRTGLSNNTDFNILNRNKIKPNIFPNDRFDRTYYGVALSYSPFADFEFNKSDLYKRQRYPVFTAEYQEGFSSWQTNNSTYRKLKGGVIHDIHLGYFNKIDYKIEAGVFLHAGKQMHSVDYQHFGASDLLVNLNSLFDSFLLLDNYEIVTNRYWTNVQINYSGKYVLLKFLPFMQSLPFTENIHLKSLVTPEIDSYIEVGYSLAITRNLAVGCFSSFKNAKGHKVGVRFSLDLKSLGLY